jgi:hypothetical protein
MHETDVAMIADAVGLPSAPIPKFANTCGTSDANFGIERGTSSFMILVRFLNLKFLHELAVQMIGIEINRTRAWRWHEYPGHPTPSG